MKTLIIALLLSMLIGCASEPVVLPSRPAPTGAEGAACLRGCDVDYVSCTGNTSPMIGISPKGMLIASILNNKNKSIRQKDCAEFLKYCYSDCEEFE